jgi:hypothetical protein
LVPIGLIVGVIVCNLLDDFEPFLWVSSKRPWRYRWRYRWRYCPIFPTITPSKLPGIGI